MTSPSDTNSYNLMSVSLIPFIIKLATNLQQFDETEQGGLLSLYPSGWNTLQQIICYCSKGNKDKKLLNDCFFSCEKLGERK